MRYLYKNYGSLHFFRNSTKYEVRIHSVDSEEVVLRREFDFSYITNIDLSQQRGNRFLVFIRDQLERVFLKGEIGHYWIVARRFKKVLVGLAVLCLLGVYWVSSKVFSQKVGTVGMPQKVKYD